MLYAIYYMQYAICYMLYTIFYILYSVCYMLYSIFCLLYAIFFQYYLNSLFLQNYKVVSIFIFISDHILYVVSILSILSLSIS